jgi:hypothetical protein
MDNTHKVQFAYGDMISIQLAPSNTPASSLVHFGLDINGEYGLCYGLPPGAIAEMLS